MKQLISLLFFISTLLPCAYSQIGFESVTINKDTFIFNETAILNADLVNYNNDTVFGPLSYDIYVNGTFATTNAITSIVPDINTIPFINPNSFLSVTFQIPINPQYFVPGPDIIIIWPIANAQVANIISKEIYVLDSTMVLKEKEWLELRVKYINGKIQIESDEIIERAELIDLNGRVYEFNIRDEKVIELENQQTSIPQLFLLRIKSNSGKERIVKLISR